MSECVVRMEMPKSCWDCPCLDDYGDYPMCEISNEQRGYNFPIHEKRMPNCPIICQLPEGHGRLIDGSNLAEKHRKLAYKDNSKYDFHITAKAWVEESITIVPAERNEL